VSLGDDGLIVPVIHDAHELSAEGLAERIRDVAGRARSRRLEPREVQDGTFTITNLGPFGTLMSTPIINQPRSRSSTCTRSSGARSWLTTRSRSGR
jgi:pyruvate/2-oxoglutarate dehydrogenase complex dihydrolipoamide acyltransferase (E2) component